MEYNIPEKREFWTMNGKTALKPKPILRKSKLSLKDHLVWCGSAVKAKNGLWTMLLSFWPRAQGHNGWVTHSQIGYAVSRDPLGPYEFKGLALGGAGKPGAWDRDVTHNPTCLYIDGKFHLYYMGNYGNGEYWDHRNHQRIGLAVAESPEGPWRRSEKPVLDVGPEGSWDSLMTSNPSVCRTPDGRYLMIYKGVAKEKPAPGYGPVKHGVAFADSPEGPFVKSPRPIFESEGALFPGEDPFVFCKDGKLRVILKDMDRNYSPERRGLVVFESEDGLDWRPGNPALALTRKLKWEDGEEQEFNRLERPQLVFDGQRAFFMGAAKPDEKEDESFNIQFEVEAKF